jgi:hypothetical protein
LAEIEVTIAIEEVEQFLRSFEEFEAATAHARFSEFASHFQYVKSGVLELGRVEATRRRHTPEFNIFNLLGLERYEVTTHSVILAELLDPAGSHGQGGLFLKLFLSRIGYPDFANRITEDPECQDEWLVWRESDRIDISIRSPRHGLLVFIENKIDAGEQDKQIERYRLLMDAQHHRYSERCLVFLTLDGRRPVTGRADRCLSYKEHISAWLGETLPTINAPHVRYLLEQYLDTIQRL